ncbi:LAFE_0H11342g1_1 [Lachancea fermentati]|uniref:RNA polymerase II subunit B1 CTD phosphatase RPAP2 homolog n=1 Tax=Lachancea fermentati TaxID=4955 RepID=A0A1G4MKB7_LACFM|nr:LAFE_0H11342g1_1 [Lachancea fermentati]
MATIDDIKVHILKPYQDHRQLTIKEGEQISLELLDYLCQSFCKDLATLRYLANFFTKETYQDLIDERNLNKRCGYPMCNQSQGRIRDPYGGNSFATKFLQQNNPYAYLSSYCGKFHYRCSQFYQVQLSEEALFGRVGVHLDDYHPKDDRWKSKITLLEDIIGEKRSNEDDLLNVIHGIDQLNIGQNNQESRKELENDLSEWLSQVKIVENESPHILGDDGKE